MAAPVLNQESLTSRLDELPTLPNIVYELSRVINDPMSSTKEVEALMANDPSLTAKVLKLVNSAYYAIPGGVTSLGRAIAHIGFDTVNQLVLCASMWLSAIILAASVKAESPGTRQICRAVCPDMVGGSPLLTEQLNTDGSATDCSWGENGVAENFASFDTVSPSLLNTYSLDASPAMRLAVPLS